MGGVVSIAFVLVGLAFLAGALINMFRGDWRNAAGGLAISLALFAAGFVTERRHRARGRRRAAELAAWKGLEKLLLSRSDLKELLDWLDRPGAPECETTFAQTVEFLQGRALPVEPTLEWLRANGGGCDCEVIYNVDDKFGAEVGRRRDEAG